MFMLIESVYIDVDRVEAEDYVGVDRVEFGCVAQTLLSTRITSPCRWACNSDQVAGRHVDSLTHLYQ